MAEDLQFMTRYIAKFDELVPADPQLPGAVTNSPPDPAGGRNTSDDEPQRPELAEPRLAEREQTPYERIVTAFHLSTEPIPLWKQERIEDALQQERRAAVRAFAKKLKREMSDNMDYTVSMGDIDNAVQAFMEENE